MKSPHIQPSVEGVDVSPHRVRAWRAPLPWIFVAGVVIAALAGFHYPAGPGLPDELLDLLGLGLALAGTALARPGWTNPGTWGAACGLLLILGQLPGAAVVGVGLAAALLGSKGLRRPDLQERLTTLCWVAAGCFALKLWEDAAGPGGAKAHFAQMGVSGIGLAALGLIWAARTDGEKAFACPLPADHYCWVRDRLRCGLLLLGVFLLIAVSIRVPALQQADHRLSYSLFKRGGEAVTEALDHVSDAGGRAFIPVVLPLSVLLLFLLRRGHAVRFYLFAVFGTVGLELLFKGLTRRPRPPWVPDSALNSFPSGHTLTATVMAATLLLLLAPLCRKRWQRGLLWSAVLIWPPLSGFARVYLGRHYVTDILGSVLLGLGWVLVCQALHAALSRPGSLPTEERRGKGVTSIQASNGTCAED